MRPPRNIAVYAATSNLLSEWRFVLGHVAPSKTSTCYCAEGSTDPEEFAEMLNLLKFEAALVIVPTMEDAQVALVRVKAPPPCVVLLDREEPKNAEDHWRIGKNVRRATTQRSVVFETLAAISERRRGPKPGSPPAKPAATAVLSPKRPRAAIPAAVA